MSDLAEFIDFVEYARRYTEVRPRRYLRDYSDPFTKYSVQEFRARYRFKPETVRNVILPLLAPDLRKQSKRGLPFAPEIMLLITLRYYATGSSRVRDNAYTISHTLLTPFRSPNSTAQENYNRSHIRTRNTIERCFGLWKRRFPCLQVGMGIKMDTVVAVICACATLHNIALLVDDLLPINWDNIHVENDDVPLIDEKPNS
ncbi:hypothetical protein HF086_016382, partial [Spodoptera exigua]